jgi:hypothetical protein
MRDARVRRAARRQLGSKARVVRHRSDGLPVLEVDGRELIYRRHHGETYFRLQLVCSNCGRGRVTWRGMRITSAADLAAADPGDVMCDPCTEDRIMANAESDVIRAKFLHREPLNLDDHLG